MVPNSEVSIVAVTSLHTALPSPVTSTVHFDSVAILVEEVSACTFETGKSLVHKIEAARGHSWVIANIDRIQPLIIIEIKE